MTESSRRSTAGDAGPSGPEPEPGADPAAAARADLAAAGAAPRLLGAGLVLPPGTDWLHGVGLALTVAATGCLGALTSSLATRIATPVLYLTSLLVLWLALRRFRAANGVWFGSGDGPWRARVVWSSLTALTTLLGIAAAVSGAGGAPGGVAVCTGIALAAGVVFTRWWVAALRDGLAPGSAPPGGPAAGEGPGAGSAAARG